MKKYLDILIFTLLFFLIFSYFSGKQEAQQNLTGVQFQSQKSSYSVPANIIFDVKNATGSGFSYNTCENVSIRKNGTLLEISGQSCEDVTLAAGESTVLDYSGHYDSFEDPGTYSFELDSQDIKLSQSVEVQYRGTLGKLFVGVFYAPLYNLMAYLIQIFNNSLGWAIIAITIIIRVLLLFPQHKMMVSQRKLQAIQPKIKELQKKYKSNQQELGMQLMQLYKKEGVNPMGSCGLLIIQMPILIVIYNIIRGITSLSNEFYLYGFMPEFHISQINPNFFGIDLLQAGGITGIILALSVAAIQFLQVKLSLAKNALTSTDTPVLEKKKGEDGYSPMMPDPEMMNKFMLYGMPAMVAVFTYTLIAGVGIYWGISTLFALLQQILVNKIIKK